MNYAITDVSLTVKFILMEILEDALELFFFLFFSFHFASFSFKLNLIVMLVLQVGDKLYIYLEFVSGGSIYKLLQEYGQLGELAIRSYTQQILSGLAYLHGKKTVHR